MDHKAMRYLSATDSCQELTQKQYLYLKIPSHYTGGTAPASFCRTGKKEKHLFVPKLHINIM